MKLSLTVQTPDVDVAIPVALLSGTLVEKLAKAAALGADGIEFLTANPSTLDASAIRDSLRKNGLAAAAVGSGAVPLVTGLKLLDGDSARATEACSRLRALIDFATAIGAPLVTIGSFRGWKSAAGSFGHQRLITQLRQAATYAHARRVRLALEPLNRYESDFIHSAEEGLALLQAADHPNLGLLLDTYHVNIEECSWTEPFRRVAAAGWLWHVHLGDNNRLAPGCGLIDFAAIVATLRNVCYTGYLSVESLAHPDPDTAAQRALTYMRHLLSGYPPST